MKKTLVLLAVLATIAVPALAQKAYIDYDSTVDFEAFKTFSWEDAGMPTLETSNALLHTYIVNAIIDQLKAAGLQQVDSNPDFYVTYHGDSETEVAVDTMSYGYGYGRGWRWGGHGYMGPSSTTVREYENGTLIIDAWSAETEELIWRGSATTTWTDNPDKMRKKVDKMIAKIVKRWDKEHRKAN